MPQAVKNVQAFALRASNEAIFLIRLGFDEHEPAISKLKAIEWLFNSRHFDREIVDDAEIVEVLEQPGAPQPPRPGSSEENAAHVT